MGVELREPVGLECEEEREIEFGLAQDVWQHRPSTRLMEQVKALDFD
jgi:hypothetical protein